MLKTFALIATLANGNVYTQDSGLTGEDCIRSLSANHELVQISDSELVGAKRNKAVFACVLDTDAATAFQPFN